MNLFSVPCTYHQSHECVWGMRALLSLPFFPHMYRKKKKHFFYPLVELYVHFLLPISKQNSFSCTECEKMLISRKLFLKISSLHPPSNNNIHTFRPGIFFSLLSLTYETGKPLHSLHIYGVDMTQSYMAIVFFSRRIFHSFSSFTSSTKCK